MNATVKEVLNFVYENDVKFIRLAFCDLFGMQKNISIMPHELKSAFEHGISFDASSINGFMPVTKSDLFLHPDPATLSVLPWRPQQGRVVRFYCDIKNPDGTDFACDTRAVLKNSLKNLEQSGYTCKVGAECEFYLFKTDAEGEAAKIPLDNGGYLDVAPLDKGENVRREICLCLEEMGIIPESSHHEQGPGQNEIDFKFSDALSCADNLLTFKTVVKTIAARNGLFASFMPKPLLDKSGNGLHVNLSIAKNGVNLFKNFDNDKAGIAKNFVAGILKKTSEITAFLNPTVNSYERFGAYEAPKYISWSHQNRSQLVRIPAATGEGFRMELRSPDPSVNPYLAFALIINAGMHGIKNKLHLPKEVNADLYKPDKRLANSLLSLPCSLTSAIELAKGSDFVKNTIGEEAFLKYIECKTEEANTFLTAENKESFYDEKYFKII